MHILVVDQCSGSKESPEWFDAFDTTAIDNSSLDELRTRDRTPTYAAHALYTGRQQQYIGEAVDRLREAGDTIERFYISAGFGLVHEETEIPPYEATFKDYDEAGIQERSDDLDIGSNLLGLVDKGPAYDIIFFALGSDYYESFDLTHILDAIPGSTLVVLFNREEDVDQRPNTVSIPARTAEAKEQGSTVIGLKGHYLKQFAAHRANGTPIESTTDLIECCNSGPTEQSGLTTYDQSE